MPNSKDSEVALKATASSLNRFDTALDEIGNKVERYELTKLNPYAPRELVDKSADVNKELSKISKDLETLKSDLNERGLKDVVSALKEQHGAIEARIEDFKTRLSAITNKANVVIAQNKQNKDHRNIKIPSKTATSSTMFLLPVPTHPLMRSLATCRW